MSRARTASGPRPARPAGRRPAGRPVAAPDRGVSTTGPGGRLAVYEAGLSALQRRDYATAAARFEEVLAPPRGGLDRDHADIEERARTYLRLCERTLNPPSAAPKSLEERIYAATIALNDGRTATARPYLEDVARTRPGDDHAEYMLAVACMLDEDVAGARAHLARAIELNPDNRVKARLDPDLQGLCNGPAAFRPDEGAKRERNS